MTLEPRVLDGKLQRLDALIVDMAGLVDRQLRIVSEGLLRGDAGRAAEAISMDDEIDTIELAIDAECERILALQQPVAVDLRLLIVAAKVNKDLERIGDQCKNIANATAALAAGTASTKGLDFGGMAERARAMLRHALRAFVDRDREAARDVLAMDAGIDSLYEQHFDAIVGFAASHVLPFDVAAHLILVNKAWERIGDHAKNIGEDVIYLVDAVDIRHSRQESADGGG